MKKPYDHLIIGCGIIGLTLAWQIKKKYPNRRIIIIDKEQEEAQHASGRNSGVLHAGFYYTGDSLKARFTVKGNEMMKTFCRQYSLPINECGKLVVARNESERQLLHTLNERGKQNGSTISIISQRQAEEIESNVQTFKEALYSPLTASVDPKKICSILLRELKNQGVDFQFNTAFRNIINQTISTNQEPIYARHIINCAGLYADKIAHQFGCGNQYTIIPFKGLYLKYKKNKTDITTNIYPVPNLKNPFLGVHFTKTVDGGIKIGPTATPAFWRENYTGLKNFSFKELAQVCGEEIRLFSQNSFGFRDLAFEEIKKYQKKYFIQQALNMVKDLDPDGFGDFTQPGIRAQLLNKKTRQLVQDFCVESTSTSLHILNAVSPAFTCSFAFSEYIVNSYLT